jgi:signal transduction histidine kinase
MEVSARGPRQDLTASDMTLLQDLARQLGVAFHAIDLSSSLQATRERLVIAREEERRRIRNDLHDGLAPTLASLQLQLGAVKALIQQNPEQAVAVVEEMREDLRDATAAVRQLVYNLRPPMLDELGLVSAIRNMRLAGPTLRLDVVAPDPMPKLPAAVEVAAFRIATEAIHNVVNHAQATQCLVLIEVDDRQLVLSVCDNGQGMPESPRPGVGLHSMRERATELGGVLTVQQDAEGGTVLTAILPIERPG